jgi:DNA-directed RNA polymerase II subunit RPB11
MVNNCLILGGACLFFRWHLLFHERTEQMSYLSSTKARSRHAVSGYLPFYFFSQLLSMPQVLFAGYKVPHPLHPYFFGENSNGWNDHTKLIGTLSSLKAKFKREFSFRDAEGSTTLDAYGTSTAGPAWTSGRDYMDF